MDPAYDFTKTARMNVTMTKSAVASLSKVAPNIKHVSFQSGSIVCERISSCFGFLFVSATESISKQYRLAGLRHPICRLPRLGLQEGTIRRNVPADFSAVWTHGQRLWARRCRQGDGCQKFLDVDCDQSRYDCKYQNVIKWQELLN